MQRLHQPLHTLLRRGAAWTASASEVRRAFITLVYSRGWRGRLIHALDDARIARHAPSAPRPCSACMPPPALHRWPPCPSAQHAAPAVMLGLHSCPCNASRAGPLAASGAANGPSAGGLPRGGPPSQRGSENRYVARAWLPGLRWGGQRACPAAAHPMTCVCVLVCVRARAVTSAVHGCTLRLGNQILRLCGGALGGSGWQGLGHPPALHSRGWGPIAGLAGHARTR